MKYLAVCGLVLAMAVPAMAVPTVQISLGVRETGQTGNIGDFMPNAGGQIEWFDYDVQTLVLDGTWQQFTFDISNTGITTSPLFTGYGSISQDRGTLEHIRIKSTGYRTPTLWVDEIRNIYDPAGPPPVVDQLISTFADDVTNPGNPYPDGTEVMFQEPGFSGSTNANYDLSGPNKSGIDNTVGYDDSHSVKIEFWFIDNDPSRWIRLTPYLAGGNPEANPLLAEAGGPTAAYASSMVTFWMMGIPEPATLALLALGGLAVLRRR